MQCARALLPNPALPEALAESYRVRGMGSPSKSKELRAELLYCKWEHTKNVIFYHMHPGETLGFVRLQTEQKTATDDPGTSAGRDLLRSTVPPSTQSRYHQNHPLPGTFHWMILVLLSFRAVNSLLSMWECLHGKLWMRRTKPFISRPWLLTWTSQATPVNCGTNWWGISPLSAPNHQWKGSCGPEKMKSAIPRRRWKGTSQAGALLMAPLGQCRSPFFCTHKRIQASHLKVPQGRACC